MEDCCPTQREVLEELERVSPGTPFLALGQTVFWDEPMKAGVIQACRSLGIERRFLSGIHDTDYFAKYPHKELRSGFDALPHNDTDTQALWSAAGEFSALFGSETVVTRDRLSAAGGKVARVAQLRPGYLDEVTEAWGWRGVVSYGRRALTTAEMPVRRLFDTLYKTFDWAVQTSLDLVAGERRQASEEAAETLRSLVCDAADDFENLKLSGLYRRIAPKMFDLVAGEHLEIETTSTTELLRFNTETCHLPRFAMVGLFLDHSTRQAACEAYNETLEGSQMYTLDRFGTGALPFDLLIPGVGRGTLRLGTRGGLVMTEDPVAFSFKKPIESVEALARVLEAKFGPDVVLVGKAVTLVGMLASEHVFVFHEGASGYVPLCRAFHRRLAPVWPNASLNPILRVTYEPWDTVGKSGVWLRLPEPLRRPFGAEEMSAESFSKRWRMVFEEQANVLNKLAGLRRPLELIQYLDESEGGQWSCLANEYQAMHRDMVSLHREVESERQKRSKTIREWKKLRAQRSEIEAKMGQHWREHFFGKSPTAADEKKREDFKRKREEVLVRLEETRAQWRGSIGRQQDLVATQVVARARDRRKSIAFEAELKRLTLIREAVLATDGLRHAGHRPAAWWFPLVSPDGGWYRETARNAGYYLESLL